MPAVMGMGLWALFSTWFEIVATAEVSVAVFVIPEFEVGIVVGLGSGTNELNNEGVMLVGSEKYEVVFDTVVVLVVDTDVVKYDDNGGGGGRSGTV